MKTKEVVRINRSTIRKNPHAGETETPVYGGITASFKYTGKDLPLLFKDEKKAYITSHGNNVFEGGLDDGALDEALALTGDHLPDADGSLEIRQNRNVQFAHHDPSPNWLYEHEDTKVTCSECNACVSHKDIPKEGVDGCVYYACPLCQGINTFNYSYEDIKDVNMGNKLRVS